MDEKLERNACDIPLPGVPMTQGQARRVQAIWQELCKVQAHPAYRAKLVEWQEARVAARQSLRGAQDAERVAYWRLRLALFGLPDEICTTWGSLALTAKNTPPDEQERSRDRFDTDADAAIAVKVGEAFDELVNLEGWEFFSTFLAGFAWALDWSTALCREADVPFYQQARGQIVEMFDGIQRAIDRGEDAAAWLTERAEEEKEEVQ